MCLRPQIAGSTIPRLRPTGSSLGIAPVDYDPVVLLKPFGPRLAAGALPSRASSMVAPGRPIRVPAFAVVPHEPLHTFHPLWPVRHYPHLRISVRGPGPSGTSTHLTRQLPGTRRVGGGRAFALPPSARSNGSCGFPASRFPVWSSPLTGNPPDPRHQMDQPGQSELVHQTSGGIMPPRRVPPSSGDEGEQASLDPAVETVEQGSYIRLPIVVPPAADDGVEDLDHRG